MAPDHNLTLFCPGCGYNLTGLIENRCPECGKTFDPEELRRRIAEGIQPITLRQAIWQLVWLPGLFLLTQGLAFVTQGVALVIALPVGLIWLIYGIVNARNLARRLAVPGSCGRDRTQMRGPWFIPVCTLGLYCCQIGLGAGPCAGIVIAMSLR